MKRNKPRTLRLGEISSGTLNPKDLVPSYLWELKRLRLTKPERKAVEDVERASEAEGYYDGNGEDGSADPVEDMVALGDILDAHTPPFAYFGSIEGDGACIGVWPSHESIDDAISEGEILRVSDRGWKCGDEENDTQYNHCHKIPEGLGWRYRLVINDHGNMTLYTRNGREVWGVV